MDAPENQNEIVELFKQGPTILENAITSLSETELDYPPQNGGWTIRQIVHHLTDGDDLWKIGIKIALGNQQSEFTLEWYRVLPQTEWAKHWNYESRSIETSMALLKASRDHIIQLLECVPDAWSKSAQFRMANGEMELIPIGFVVQMQADHVVHHAKRIAEIRKEISGT